MAQLNSLVVTGNTRLIGDANTNAIYAAGNVRIGTSTQSTLPTTGIAIHDIRNIDATPLFLNQSVNFYFTNRSTPYGSSLYYSVMHVNGWNGNENYNSWEIAGPSHTGDQRTAPLYIRSSSASTWGSWRQIYDSSNHDGTKVNKSGDTMSGALNLSYTASATMTYASTNPQIGFSENGSQGVKILYTDYDSYRAPYGLKVIGDGTAGAAWFEVEGSIFCNGGKYNSYFTATPTSGQVVITDGTAGGTKSSGYTIATSVPSGAKFTDTTYTFAGGTNSFTVTPLGASAQTVSLTVSDSTKLPLTGGTMTGDIIFNKTGATDLTQVQMKCGVNDYGRVAAGGTASNSGWMEIATADDGTEPIYARQYSGVYSSIVRTATLLDASGNTSFPGKLTVSKAINELITGTGTAAQDKGSSADPRYFPALWTFNKAIATPSDGDTITIKIPVAGHDYGVFISLDNGTTYKPVGLKTQDNGRLTTHFANGKIITLVYDSAAVVDQVFAAAGANSRTNITGAWKVITSYLDGNSNTYDRNLFNGTIKCGSTAIVAANIIVGKDGVYHHLKDGTAFDVSYPILYAAGAIAANATGTNNYDIIHFTVTTTQSITLTAYKPVFIKGTLVGTIFTPVNTTPLIQTIPTTSDGYYYIYLGNATNTTTIYLQERHPIYAFLGERFQEVTTLAKETYINRGVIGATTDWNNCNEYGSYKVQVGTWGSADTYHGPNAYKSNIYAYGLMFFMRNDSEKRAFQIYYPHSTTEPILIRNHNAAEWNTGWSGWYSIAVAGACATATSATSATKATQDGDGKTISSTYLKLAGGTVTGATTIKSTLTLHRESTTTEDLPAQLNFSVKDTTTGQTYNASGIYAYNDHNSTTYGNNIVIQPGGGLFIGSGESPVNHYNLKKPTTTEDTYITADQLLYLQGNGNTIANRKGFAINTSQELVPVVADVTTANTGSLGNASYNINTAYIKTIYEGGTALSSKYAVSGHTHTVTIAADSGTNQLSMAASTKYKITAAGGTYIFTTPADTKNTAGSTDTSSKIFLIGATSQAANPQTYSDNEVYATSGILTTKSVQVGGTAATMQYNSTNHCIDFIVT